MKRHSIQIPASTSNLGAGFDALSLALQRYLRVSIEECKDFRIDKSGESLDAIPTTADNLILRVAHNVARRRSRSLPAFAMSIHNEIPLARGLGSSAAAILAGITCYELMTEDRLADDEIFRQAFEFEPHPDNLAAGLYGGLVSAATSSTGRVCVAKLEVASGIAPVVVIPDFELSTEKARAALPSTYSRNDTVYNIQRSALTVAVLTSGKWPLLREAMRDRVHQPYRASLIPGLEEILELQMPGLVGIALSGAGPTVLALTETQSEETAGREIAKLFMKHGVQAAFHALAIDRRGRVIT